MPNYGKYVLNDLQFDRDIKTMPDRELLEFTAKLGYSNAIRITSLENRGKKTIGAVGGFGALMGGVIVGIIDYITRRFDAL